MIYDRVLTVLCPSHLEVFHKWFVWPRMIFGSLSNILRHIHGNPYYIALGIYCIHPVQLYQLIWFRSPWNWYVLLLWKLEKNVRFSRLIAIYLVFHSWILTIFDGWIVWVDKLPLHKLYTERRFACKWTENDLKKYFGIKKSKKKIQTKNRRIENIPEKLKLSKKS